MMMGCVAPKTMTPSYSAAAVGAESGAQIVAALQHIRSEEQRLQAVAWKLSAANLQLCPGMAGPVYGLQVWNEAAFDETIRPSAVYAFQVGPQLTVANVIPNSPAASVGLAAGDRIASANGIAIPAGDKAIKTYVEAVDKAHAAGKTAIDLRVETAAGARDVKVAGIGGCMFNASIVADDKVNAFADGRNVYITRGMMRFAKDENELAIIVGHELAHNAMGHAEAQSDNAVAGGALGLVLDVAVAATTGYAGSTFTQLGSNLGTLQYSVEFEQEADYVGLYAAERAGYDPAKATAFWRRLSVEFPESISDSYTHPAAPERFVAMDAGMKEIEAKKAAYQPLVPNLKPDA